MHHNISQVISVLFCSLMLSALLFGCGHEQSSSQTNIDPSSSTAPVKKAQKMSTDATQVAHVAWNTMNQLDGMLADKKLTTQQIEEMIRTPIREISTTWRTHVRIADDSVVEDNYVMCRKALNDLDIWARQVQAQHADKTVDPARYQADYQRDKTFCQKAINDH